MTKSIEPEISLIRDANGRFVPGHSGNIKGRPKIPEVLEKHVEKAALTLIRLLDSQDEKMRANAAISILDRVLGKPKQETEVTGGENPLLLTMALIDRPPGETREQWEARVKDKIFNKPKS